MLNSNVAPIRRVTPEALAAWRAKDRWGLHRALRLKPWDLNPLDVTDERPQIDPEAFVGRVFSGIGNPFPSNAAWRAARQWSDALKKAACNAD